MKQTIRTTFGMALLSVLTSTGLGAETPAPGYVDFGKFSPPAAGGEFVEVNISNNLISMVARLGEKSEPQVAELLRGLQGIRVNVIGLNDENRAELQKRVKAIRGQLETQ